MIGPGSSPGCGDSRNFKWKTPLASWLMPPPRLNATIGFDAVALLLLESVTIDDSLTPAPVNLSG